MSTSPVASWAELGARNYPVAVLRIGMSDEEAAARRAADQSVPDPITLSALIDTGSSHTFAPNEVFAALGLTPVGFMQCKVASADELRTMPVYRASLEVITPDGPIVRLPNVTIDGGELHDGCQGVLGMNTITAGRLRLTVDGARGAYCLERAV